MAKVGLRLNYSQQDPAEEGRQSVAEAARAALAQQLLQTRAGSARIGRSESRGQR